MEKNIVFELDEDESKRAREWIKKHRFECKLTEFGAIGGRFTYSFTQTSIGLLSSIECACGARELLSENL